MSIFGKEIQKEPLVTSWEEIQKNTFTRWCNFHLKNVHKEIKNLSKDFSDGLHLIALLQVLSNQKIKKYHKKPIFRQMKLENVSIALLFTTSEKIKLVSIGEFNICLLFLCQCCEIDRLSLEFKIEFEIIFASPSSAKNYLHKHKSFKVY